MITGLRREISNLMILGETIYLFIWSIDCSICPSTLSQVACYNYSSFSRTSKNLTKRSIKVGLYYSLMLPIFKITLLSILGSYNGKAKKLKIKKYLQK